MARYDARGSDTAIAMPASFVMSPSAAAAAAAQSGIVQFGSHIAALDRSPSVEILEQPKQRGLRFRYKCEGRSAGSILGETSSNQHKSFPKIRINNFDSSVAIIVVSCVTHEAPYSPHPHSLVGTDCKDGVCTVKLKGINTVTFTNIGIQCCKRQEVAHSLQVRENMRVNPFGAPPTSDMSKIDLSTVRLCFQAFLPDAHGKFTRIVPPVVSQPIIDKKSVRDLVICRLSRQSGYAIGGDEVFLLCEKINKDDIQVRFFEETEDGISWEAFGEFSPQDVHHQYAIVFQTPPYKDSQITSSVQVYIQLRRPSDEDVSDPKPFQYIPVDPDPYLIQSKRKRLESEMLDSDSTGYRIPSSVLPHSVKDDYDEISSVPSSSSNLKQNLKTKVERRIGKKEKLSMTSPASVPQYSYDSVTPEGANSFLTSLATAGSGLVLGDDGKLYAVNPGMQLHHQFLPSTSSSMGAGPTHEQVHIYDLSTSHYAAASATSAAADSDVKMALCAAQNVSVSDAIAAATSVVDDKNQRELLR